MAVEVILPKLGATMEEGRIVAWLKREGDEVRQGEPLFEVETDKVNMVVEAPSSGILREVTLQDGATAPVGQVIALITAVGEEVRGPGPARQATKPGSYPASKEVERDRGLEYKVSDNAVRTADIPAASPAAKKLARENRINLGDLVGSGPGGRIVEADVKQAIERLRPGRKTAQVVESTEETIPLSRIRKKTAERMAASFQTIPHFYLTVEVLADRLVALRQDLLAPVERQVGVRLSFTDLFVKCLAVTLRKHPHVNAAWIDGELRLKHEINVGFAAATEDGLIVPVIRRADSLSIAEIAKQRARLTEQARNGSLSFESIQGGTITLTNLGSYGIDMFAPIINPPQAAILAVGRIADRRAGVAGTVGLRPTVFLTLAADHRIMDGHQAALFLNDLKNLIQNLSDKQLGPDELSNP